MVGGWARRQPDLERWYEAEQHFETALEANERRAFALGPSGRAPQVRRHALPPQPPRRPRRCAPDRYEVIPGISKG